MKKILLGVLLAVSSSLMAADWKFAAPSPDGGDIYVDATYYNYKGQTNIVDAWFKTDEFISPESEDMYTKSKNLWRFSCLDREAVLLSFVTYDVKQKILESYTQPEKNPKMSVIVPDSVGESIWEVACTTKGKGFKLPKWRLGKRISAEEMKKLGLKKLNVENSEVEGFARPQIPNP